MERGGGFKPKNLLCVVPCLSSYNYHDNICFNLFFEKNTLCVVVINSSPIDELGECALIWWSLQSVQVSMATNRHSHTYRISGDTYQPINTYQNQILNKPKKGGRGGHKATKHGTRQALPHEAGTQKKKSVPVVTGGSY